MPNGTKITDEICIVGAGAAGITLAMHLQDCGIRCCLLESGGLKQDEATQSLHDIDNVGYPLRENFMARVRYFGGSCNVWAGRTMRLSPLDFERREWIPESGWPITYEDIKPYYQRAERLLKLPSIAISDKAEGLSASSNEERRLFQSPDVGPTVALWGVKPMRFGKAFGRTIRRSNTITLYLNANVTELVATDYGQSVKELVVKTMNQKRMTVQANTYVLATGGLENTRLLLNSRSQHRSGFGNEHDVVGRYYLDHPRAIFGSVHVNQSVRLPLLTGLPLADGKIQFGVAMSEQVQRNHGLVNSYASLEPQMSEFAEHLYGRSINAAKVLLRRGHAGSRFQFSKMNVDSARDIIYLLTPKEIMPHFLYRPYAMIKRLVRGRRELRKLTVINFCEQSPDPNSRVTVTQDRDALGTPKLKLDWRIGDDVRRSVHHLQRVLGKCVKNAGIGTMEPETTDIDALEFLSMHRTIWEQPA